MGSGGHSDHRVGAVMSERVYWRSTNGSIEWADPPQHISIEALDESPYWQRVHVLTDEELTARDEQVREDERKRIVCVFEGRPEDWKGVRNTLIRNVRTLFVAGGGDRNAFDWAVRDYAARIAENGGRP